MSAQDDSSTLNVTMNAIPPVSFGIGLQGELVIDWIAGMSPDGHSIRTHVVIPPESIKTLRRCLDETQTIQETPPRCGQPPLGGPG
jgi:hypothetical protein